MDDPKLVDLEPHQWASEREKPREPFFGSGWPMAVGTVIGIVGAAICIEAGYGPLASGSAGIVGAIIGGAITAAIRT